MIYSTEIKEFPDKSKYHECQSYVDKNGLEWKIAVVDNGFFIAYFGDDYFKETFFSIKVGKKEKVIKNSGCFFMKDGDVDDFYSFRTILKNGFTDEIWDCIESFIEQRLNFDSGLTECEIIMK